MTVDRLFTCPPTSASRADRADFGGGTFLFILRLPRNCERRYSWPAAPLSKSHCSSPVEPPATRRGSVQRFRLSLGTPPKSCGLKTTEPSKNKSRATDRTPEGPVDRAASLKSNGRVKKLKPRNSELVSAPGDARLQRTGDQL